jgi:signal transduction histidine kinase
MTAYDDAVAALYRAPFAEFVTERKRLAAELKTAGDKDAAARVTKLVRPPVSAWAVNQLWWQERETFEALLAAAARVKVGEREAARPHREALATLRESATRLLQDGGNAASESTLRRVAATLSAIAAAGGFEPEPPGALSADRDPPGFEALGFGASSEPVVTKPHVNDAAERAAEAERRRAEAEAQKRRLAERERLSEQVHDARTLLAAQQRELSRLRSEAEAAEQSLKQTQALLAQLETKLSSL